MNAIVHFQHILDAAKAALGSIAVETNISMSMCTARRANKHNDVLMYQMT